MWSYSSENVFKYEKKNLLTDCGPLYQEMQKNEKLCDITIKVKDKSISAHRVILAGAIPYFYKMFCADNPESDKKMEIVMQEFDPIAIETLIRFCYSGTIEIAKENLESLIICANLLELPEILKNCVDFLNWRNLKPDNAIKFYSLGNSIKCDQLIANTKNYIKEKFSEVVLSDDLLDLNYEEITKIIEGENLKLAKEEDIYEATMKWVKHKEEERAEKLSEILPKVRLISLPSEYLVCELSNENLIKKSQKCRELVEEAKNHQLISKTQELNSISNAHLHQTEVIFIAGPNGLRSTHQLRNAIHIFKDNKWSKVTDMRGAREDFEIVYLKGKLYVIGKNIFESLALKVYVHKSNEWTEEKCMNEERSGFAVATLDDHIYAIGGRDKDRKNVTTVERFSVAEREWKPVSPLNIARSGFFAVTLNGQIYAVGDESSERYCAVENKWTTIESMKAKNVYGAVTLNGKLYVCGYSLCKVYDPETDSSSTIASMNESRIQYPVATCNGKLYAIGGSDGRILSAVEEYCPESDGWKVAIPLPDTAYGLRAVGASIHN